MVSTLFIDTRSIFYYKTDEDEAFYIKEAIRSVFGINIENPEEYIEYTPLSMLNKISYDLGIELEGLINKKDVFINDLYYAFYNLFGHALPLVKKGVLELINWSIKNNINIYILTPEIEKINRYKILHAGLAGYFNNGLFGDNYIVDELFKEAKKIAIDSIFITNSMNLFNVSKSIGINSFLVNDKKYDIKGENILKNFSDISKIKELIK